MQWRWQWFLAGVGGLFGLGLLRGLLRVLSPVAVLAVGAYGLGVLLRRPEGARQPRKSETVPKTRAAGQARRSGKAPSTSPSSSQNA